METPDSVNISIIIAIIAAVTSLGGVWLTTRATTKQARKAAQQAKQASDQTRELERGKVDAEAYARARASYDAAIDELEARITRLRDELRETREEHVREMKEMTDRVGRLEGERERNRQYIRRLNRDLHLLSEWARGLLHDLRSRGIAHPPPPVDLGDSDPDGMPPIPA